MKTSYVHVQTPFGRSLGFSAMLSDIEGWSFDMPSNKNERGDTLCTLAITFCNRKDKHFNKAVARAELAKKEAEVVRVKDVPRLLAEAFWRADGFSVPEPELMAAWVRNEQSRFNYVLRRFV